MTGFRDLIIAVGGLISQLTILVAGMALLVFFWGLARFMFKAGDEKAKEEGKNIMVWGIITLFVMVSVWGIIGFIQRDLGLRGVILTPEGDSYVLPHTEIVEPELPECSGPYALPGVCR